MRQDKLPSDSLEGFLKVDLHIHTPESRCYGDTYTTHRQIVDAAVAAGLDVIAVTDHNTFRGVEPVSEAASRDSIAVFPGTELTTPDGHLLALFDIGTPIARLQEFLTSAGVSPGAAGDGSVTTQQGMEDLLEKIARWRGLAVPAHIERWPTGFLQSNRSRQAKIAIHSSPHLSALEITQPENKELWNTGGMRNYPLRHACVQGSDAHDPEEIGRRPTYLSLPSIDLDGLRTAFAEFEARIRFPDEMPPLR